jgi:DNA modification methylase
MERTPDAYVANMVAVFREVWRVLRDDGVVFLNLGDTYAANRSYQVTDSKWCDVGNSHGSMVPVGLKPKDLCMIPARVALALQADGWYLRSDIIWSKPNPMPESVTDRPTKAHEYVFLLTKRERYYWNQDAVREPLSNETTGGNCPDGGPRINGIHKFGSPHLGRDNRNPDGRNIRSVWTIPTQPFPGAHFATMPEALVERCLLAGSREGDVVLDPFAGSGTVVAVAERWSRCGVGVELNPAYADLARRRVGGLAVVAPVDDEQPRLWGT